MDLHGLIKVGTHRHTARMEPWIALSRWLMHRYQACVGCLPLQDDNLGARRNVRNQFRQVLLRCVNVNSFRHISLILLYIYNDWHVIAIL